MNTYEIWLFHEKILQEISLFNDDCPEAFVKAQLLDNGTTYYYLVTEAMTKHLLFADNIQSSE
jgi:hypothetical protein